MGEVVAEGYQDIVVPEPRSMFLHQLHERGGLVLDVGRQRWQIRVVLQQDTASTGIRSHGKSAAKNVMTQGYGITYSSS